MADWPFAIRPPWPISELTSLTSKIGSGATPRGGKEVYISHGISFIRSQNVHDNRLIAEGIAHITDEAADMLRNVEVRDGDVLLNITGDSITRCCVVDPGVLPARVSQHVAIIRPTSKMNSTFLQKVLVQHDYKAFMFGMSSGGTRNAITKAQIGRFPVPTPSRPVQDAIAAVLGALDDKIAINYLLASGADNLLRACFTAVNQHAFRRVKLGNIINLRYGKALKEDSRIPGSIPVYGGNGISGWHQSALVDGPGVIVGRKGANAGSVSWSQNSFWPIDTAFYAEPVSEIVSREFLFVLLDNIGLRGLVGDSAIPGLNREIALGCEVLLPIGAAVDQFTSVARPLLSLHDQLSIESRSLAELHDVLLPRLMSGEIRVRDAEKIVGDAT